MAGRAELLQNKQGVLEHTTCSIACVISPHVQFILHMLTTLASPNYNQP